MERDTNKLPADFKAKWIAALRSGEYTQQREGTLRCKEGYCCLGVAGVVLGFDLPLRDDSGEKFKAVYTKMDQLFGNGETKKILWNMNDSEDKSFSEIADYIEENL